MTVIAANKKRVTLPTKPGERFDLQAQGGDRFILTRLAPVAPRKARVSIKKVGGDTVGRLGHLVNAEALKQALESRPAKSDEVTDFYLATLAQKHGCKLATLDASIKHSAVTLI